MPNQVEKGTFFRKKTNKKNTYTWTRPRPTIVATFYRHYFVSVSVNIGKFTSPVCVDVYSWTLILFHSYDPWMCRIFPLEAPVDEILCTFCQRGPEIKLKNCWFPLKKNFLKNAAIWNAKKTVTEIIGRVKRGVRKTFNAPSRNGLCFHRNAGVCVRAQSSQLGVQRWMHVK